MAARDGARGAGRRIIAATIAVVGRHGYQGLTLPAVAAAARVSVDTVRRHYATREECFLAAYRQASAELVAVALDAYGAERDWVDGLRAGLRALLEAAAADPARARVCFVEAAGAGRRAIRAREETMGRLEGLFDRAPGNDEERTPLIARGLVGGLDFVIQRQIVAGKTAELSHLADDLTRLVAAPFVGRSATQH